MAERRKNKAKAEFGDFQTPEELAVLALSRLPALNVSPRRILEPTCGRGTFIAAALKTFPLAEVVVGVEINPDYVSEARMIAPEDERVQIRGGDFFQVAWEQVVDKSCGPWLILGNPPWVTSAELGALESENLPEKSNFHGRPGIDAITGKSNFDISEWMLLRYLEWLDTGPGTIAVLCKTAVARKVLRHAWRAGLPLYASHMFKIDALASFGAAVDACFLVIQVAPDRRSDRCDVYESLKAGSPSHVLGYVEGFVVPNLTLFEARRHVMGPEKAYVWRSGIKHDCAKVMELVRTANGFQNALGESVEIEETMMYPLLKSSDVGNGRTQCRGAMLVTQQVVGEETRGISMAAPLAWDYLVRHAEMLDGRRSVIYRKKPRFSIFGVGAYSFAPWKVAISGFYKKVAFLKVGPVDGRPVVFDDTVYFLPCWSEEEADFLEKILTSDLAQEFLHSVIHWDEKRPITVDILQRLSIGKVASALGLREDYERFTGRADLQLFSGQHVGV